MDTFKIKISDSFVEYEYSLPIGVNHSIEEIYKVLCEHYNIEPEEGILIENHRRLLRK